MTTPLFIGWNPFRNISSEDSMSKELAEKLSNYEEKLSWKITQLTPRNTDYMVNFRWMMLAIHILCELFADIKVLVEEIHLPMQQWDIEWKDIYRENALKLLDLCNGFTFELSRLIACNYTLESILQKLTSKTSDKVNVGKASLDNWREEFKFKHHPDLQKCNSILESFMKSMILPKVKKSGKCEVVMHALYGANVVIIFICNIFVSILLGSSERLIDMNIVQTYKWVEAFEDLQQIVHTELKKTYASEQFPALKELQTLDSHVERLLHSLNLDDDCMEEKMLQDSVSTLEGSMDKVSNNLLILKKELDVFFQTVLASRHSLY